MHRSMRWTRVAAVATTLTLALGATACGDDNDDGGSQSNSGDSAAGKQANGGKSGGGKGFSGREAAVEAALIGLQDDFVSGDGAGYCNRLTAAGRRQVAEFGKAYFLGKDCIEVVAKSAKSARDSGIKQQPTRLISVKFKGDRASATVRDGRRPPQEMVFVDVGGDWKLPDPGFQTALDGGDSQQAAGDSAKRIQELLRGSGSQSGQGSGR